MVHPSEIWSTGPRPFTKFSRLAVTGMPPRVAKWVEKPPPGKYSWVAAWNVVADRSFLMSSSVISHQCLMIGLPSSSVFRPVPFSVVAPELRRSMNPPAATPLSSWPVTRFTASGLQ